MIEAKSLEDFERCVVSAEQKEAGGIIGEVMLRAPFARQVLEALKKRDATPGGKWVEYGGIAAFLRRDVVLVRRVNSDRTEIAFRGGKTIFVEVPYEKVWDVVCHG